MIFLVRECAYVCVRVCVCLSVSACVWVCLRMCACVYVRSDGSKNTSGQTCQIFVAARYARKVFHVYIMIINYCHIWKVLALVD